MNIFGVGIGSNPREVAINPPGLSSVYSQMANYIDMTGQDGGTAGDGKIQNLKIAEAYNDLQDYQEGRSSSVSPETMALIEKLGQLKLDTNDKNAVSNEVKRLEDTFTQDAVKTDGGDRRVVDTEGEKISYPESDSSSNPAKASEQSPAPSTDNAPAPGTPAAESDKK